MTQCTYVQWILLVTFLIDMRCCHRGHLLDKTWQTTPRNKSWNVFTLEMSTDRLVRRLLLSCMRSYTRHIGIVNNVCASDFHVCLVPVTCSTYNQRSINVMPGKHMSPCTLTFVVQAQSLNRRTSHRTSEDSTAEQTLTLFRRAVNDQ